MSNAQVVLPVSVALRGWLRAAVVTAFVAFSGLVPTAFANCHASSASTLGVPTIPVAAKAAAASTKSSAPVSIVGLWNLQFLSSGAIVDVAFDAWHADGTEVLNDYTDPINGNVCLGVWEQTGSRTYKLKHPSWYFDGAGNLLGTIIIRETVCVSADGNTFTGTYTDDVYDVLGNFQEELTGQVKATRIKVD